MMLKTTDFRRLDALKTGYKMAKNSSKTASKLPFCLSNMQNGVKIYAVQSRYSSKFARKNPVK